MAFLTVRIKGVEGYTRSVLGKERMVLGRASATDLPIKHTSISREHCAFVRDVSTGAERWFVEDLGSSNGTWVGKTKVNGRQALSEKDIVKVGHARLTFHAGEMSQADAIEVAGEDDAAGGSADGPTTASEASAGSGACSSAADRPTTESANPVCGGTSSIALGGAATE